MSCVVLAIGLLVLAASAAATAASVADADTTPSDTSCADVIVYVVRGSGEAPKEGAGAAAYDPAHPTAGYADTWDAFDPIDDQTRGSSILADRELDRAEVATGTPFLYDLVQKIHKRVGGQVKLSWAPIRYPAVPVDIRSIPRGGLWLLHGYPNSVTSGIRELNRTLRRQWESCGTRTRFVLAGYSQGADVVTSYLRGKIRSASSEFGLNTLHEYLGPSKDIAQQISAVTLIADPNHDPADPESYTRIDPQLSQEGGQAHFRAGVPGPAGAVTDSICLVDDPVCGQGTGKPDIEKAGSVHSDGYTDAEAHPVSCKLGEEDAGTQSAVACLADRVVWRLGVRNLVRQPLAGAGTSLGSSRRDVAFLVDTTGSMQDDIDSALAFAQSQADRIVSLDGRVALAQYRDDVDDPPAGVVVPFTSDMTQFQDGLSSLTADGGGDEPEALLHALMLSFDDLDWEYGASKAAVILTDATYHEPDPVNGETLPQVERRSLEIDPVNVFPVVDDVVAYEGLAARTSGQVIDKSSGDTEAALTRALDNIADRPSAVLQNGTYFTAPGRQVRFDASGSRAVSGSLTEYRWDLDGDGFTDETTSTPTINHTYPPGYHGQMQVLVVDDSGRSANASAAVLVAEEPTPGLVPRVPAASSMTADATDAGRHLALDVAWDPGAARPRRWVVSLEGDPVTTAVGSANEAHLAVPYQDDDWRVTVTPMDDDGNLGDAYTARLEAMPGDAPWWQRPLVWAAGAAAGLVAAALVWTAVRPRQWSSRGELPT